MSNPFEYEDSNYLVLINEEGNTPSGQHPLKCPQVGP